MKKSTIAVTTIFAMATARAVDLATTFHFEPSLAGEANPLVSWLGAGWHGLLLANAVVIFLIVIGIVFYLTFPTKSIPPFQVKDTWEFASVCLYNRILGKGRLISALVTGWPLPRDWKQAFRLFSFCVPWAVIFASCAAATLSRWAHDDWQLTWYGQLCMNVWVGIGPLTVIAVGLAGIAAGTVIFFRIEYNAANRVAGI